MGAMAPGNDLCSSLIHLLTALGFLLATPHLLRRLGHAPGRRLAGAVHVFCLLFMLVMSGLYHMSEFREGPGPDTEAFRRLDHVGVWVMIAGSALLPHLLVFQGFWRWGPLAVVWTGALVGITLKLFFFGALTISQSFVIYAAVSVVMLASVVRMAQLYGTVFIRLPLVIWGCYAAGAACFVLTPPDLIPGVFGHHELWHLGISAGALAHWRFVLREAAVGRFQQAEVKDDGDLALGSSAPVT